MRIFAVYRHPAPGHEAVKQGFSWPGFFFIWIWAFVKGLWAQGGILLGAMLLLAPLDVTGIIPVLLFFGAPLLFGFQGNHWRVAKLSRDGYALLQTVRAENPAAAIASVRGMGDMGDMGGAGGAGGTGAGGAGAGGDFGSFGTTP